MSSFFGSAGFYIALLLCVCVVGVAGYAWLFGGNEPADEATEQTGMDTGGSIHTEPVLVYHLSKQRGCAGGNAATSACVRSG